jgi:hypothetical protein
LDILSQVGIFLDTWDKNPNLSQYISTNIPTWGFGIKKKISQVGIFYPNIFPWVFLS